MSPTDGHSRARTVLARPSVVLAALAVSACVAASVWLLPGAPTALRSAQPDLNAHVGRAPEQVRLTFGQPTAPGSDAAVTVLGPDDEDLARGPAVPGPEGVSQPVAPPRERGAYQVVYEVRLLDGTFAIGQYWFWYAPGASGSSARWESPALLGLLVALAAALAAGLVTPGRRGLRQVTVPTQRTGSPTPATTGHPVPVQRSRESHGGLSPPRSSPRHRPTPGQPSADPTKPIPPRNL